MKSFIYRRSTLNNDTGFGTNASSYGGRFVNRDGTFNLRREGRSFWQRISLYNTMLNLSQWKFISIIFIFFITINLFYTTIYFLLGANDFLGLIASTHWTLFKELYFFSTETFTTVGYGRVNPSGDLANFIASIEALTGFLSFAIATGLIYGRFAKPKAYLIFSEQALISPYQEGTGLMFRLVSYKDHHTLTDVEVRLNLALQIEENGKQLFKFYNLELERSKVDNLPMNWTVVHPVDENSPLWGLNEADMKKGDVEVYVTVRGFDDVFSNFVLQRTSYTYDEIKFNRKFKPMYRESDDGKTTIIELNKLSEHMEVVIS